MPRNVEIKAKALDLATLHRVATQLSGGSGKVLYQEDTFYNSPKGRLKLRKIKDEQEELIYYERDDKIGPKGSDYVKVNGKEGELSGTMATLLEKCLGIKGVVKKKRTLYLVGQTRVHVDQVEGLGNFMELEVTLKDDETLEQGEEIAKDLMKKLGVDEDALLSGAYMDMLK
ncbi:uncharacterized protein LOC143040675 [Oratosquilla oratoria]|uniref:uncharacterized protein LOC143040675 n=1 Tax=Oratosquilla oratoria TaxID=337810 RepID=UPI003F769B8B